MEWSSRPSDMIVDDDSDHEDEKPNVPLNVGPATAACALLQQQDYAVEHSFDTSFLDGFTIASTCTTTTASNGTESSLSESSLIAAGWPPPVEKQPPSFAAVSKCKPPSIAAKDHKSKPRSVAARKTTIRRSRREKNLKGKKFHGMMKPLKRSVSTLGDQMNSLTLKFAPIISEKEQVTSEYMLPIVLPMLFTYFQFSTLGHAWVVILVIGHTLETAVTDFGPSTRMYRCAPMLSSLQHHLCDCGWLHTLITTMLVRPDLFSPTSPSKAFWMGILLIQTLPVYLSVSFKSHFARSSDQHKTSGCDNDDKNKERIRRLGNHLGSCFAWYFVSTGVLISSTCPMVIIITLQPLLLAVGLLLFNASPWIIYSSYKAKFCEE